MHIDEKLIQNNQDIINFFNADAMFDDLQRDIEKYGYDYIFKREFDTEEEVLINYSVRLRIVKLAMDACEHYSKAILIKNGSNWDEMKSVGHNLLKAYNLFDEEDKNIIKSSIFFENSPQNESSFDNPNTMRIGINNKFKTKKLDELSFEEILLSFSSGKVLPNIESRYPGQKMVDYDEKFIVAYAHILHELCYKYKSKREYFETRNNLTR